MTKSNRRSNRRDWRRIAFIAISIIIVLSMALALLLAFAPPPTQ